MHTSSASSIKPRVRVRPATLWFLSTRVGCVYVCVFGDVPGALVRSVTPRLDATDAGATTRREATVEAILTV